MNKCKNKYNKPKQIINKKKKKNENMKLPSVKCVASIKNAMHQK